MNKWKGQPQELYELAYSGIPVRFARDLAKSVARSVLPDNWRSYPPPAALQVVGDEWIEDLGEANIDSPHKNR